MIELD